MLFEATLVRMLSICLFALFTNMRFSLARFLWLFVILLIFFLDDDNLFGLDDIVAI